MIIPVAKLRQYISTDAGDQVLEERLQALELLIRGYTNNSFQVRGTGRVAYVIAGRFHVDALNPYEIGDTLQISGSERNDGLYTVRETDDHSFSVNEPMRDGKDLFVTLVEYPADVQIGVIELLKYDLEGREKAGVQSESISRHTVTYQTYDGTNTVQGYPAQLMGFLNRYKRARFGQGLRA